MMVTIVMHGRLRAAWPSGWACEAETPAEALRAFQGQHKLGPRVQVRVAGCPSQASLHSPLRGAELHVVPDFSGGGGAIKIIIGVIIVIVAVLLSEVTGGASLLAIGPALSLILGGVIELLTPAPKTNKDPAVESKFLGNAKNTTKIGTPIPIGYGRYPTYGQYISFGIAAIPSAALLDANAKRLAQGLGN